MFDHFKYSYLYAQYQVSTVHSVDIGIPFSRSCNYAFPTGSVYGFGIKWCRWRQRRTPASSDSTSNIKIMHVVNKAGLFHILFGLIKF